MGRSGEDHFGQKGSEQARLEHSATLCNWHKPSSVSMADCR
jgi:hypothetical protein